MIENSQCWLRGRCKLSNSCPEFCVKLFKLEQLTEQALLTSAQRKYISLRLDADGTDRAEYQSLKEIEKDIVSFVQEGRNLYIHSRNTGNGKTAWTLRLLNGYLERIWPTSDLTCRGLFINVPRFLISLKDSISRESPYIDHIKENALTADLIVFDEIGVKALTTYEHEHLLSIVNARIDAGKSNIYTSNLSPEELHEVVGDRLYSRIVNYSLGIEFKGQDKRGLL